MTKTPHVNSEGQKELEKAKVQIDKFNEQVQAFDPIEAASKAPRLDMEPQTKLSNREIKASDAPYIKPVRAIARSGKPTWNERFKEHRDRDWEYVKVIVENMEVIGESVECWTCKWGCDPAHFWKVPVNKPVYIPRLLANQLATCRYNRLKTEDVVVSQEGFMQQYGNLVVEHNIARIDIRKGADYKKDVF